jgi:LmbE family N-acetylglucosaminyl deacetylase
VSNLPVCPPYTWPAVFFAPHPDDETLAMEGAIKEHINGGRQVYVELLTQGEASGARAILQNGGSCPWHSGSHSYALTPTQFGQARVAEFLEAMVSLGVHGVTVSDLGDGNLTVSEVAGRIGFWEQHKPAQGVSYKGTLGTSQSGAGGANHPDHIATWNALTTSGLADVRGYNSSFYTPSSGKPVNTHPLASSVCSAKTSAMAAYKLWSPTAGRYAVGYHSVASTFDSLASSCEEYVLYYMP